MREMRRRIRSRRGRGETSLSLFTLAFFISLPSFPLRYPGNPRSAFGRKRHGKGRFFSFGLRGRIEGGGGGVAASPRLNQSPGPAYERRTEKRRRRKKRPRPHSPFTPFPAHSPVRVTRNSVVFGVPIVAEMTFFPSLPFPLIFLFSAH